MLDVKVVWLTCEYGTEMVTPLPVVSKHRKLSPASKGGRPELIVRVICSKKRKFPSVKLSTLYFIIILFTLVGVSNTNLVGVTLVLEIHRLVPPCTHLVDTVLF